MWEGTPGMRARPLTEPTATMQATATQALATPPGFLFATHHGGRTSDLDAPHPTVCASDDRQALILTQRGGDGDIGRRSRPVSDPLPTATAEGQNHALLLPMRRNGKAQPTDAPAPAVTAGGTHHGLLMRNNGTRGEGWAVTPIEEPARSMTTKGHQSLLVPYNGQGRAKPTAEPLGTQPATDRWSLVDVEAIVDDCGFRMLEPYEIAAAMAFPDGYIPRDLTKRDQVKLAGNAVTPPVMTWITGRLVLAWSEWGIGDAIAVATLLAVFYVVVTTALRAADARRVRRCDEEPLRSWERLRAELDKTHPSRGYLR